MARKEFKDVEAVSAVMPGEGGYSAAIAVKANAGGPPRFHPVLDAQKFKTAHEADQAAVEELARLVDVDADGELVF
jgi:hypothetical protein